MAGQGMSTGEHWTISGHGYEAEVVECGGGLRTLTHDGRPLLAPFGENEVITGGRGQLLMPWPNRIRDGAYSFGGRDLQLALSEAERHNAMHGLVRWCRWALVEATADRIELGYRLMAQSGYPWTLDLTATYVVAQDGLTVTLSAANRSASAAPFAAGMHPYLTAGSPLVDEDVLAVPAATHQLVDDRLLPAGTEPAEGDRDYRAGRQVADVVLDDAYTDLVRGDDGLAVVRLEGPATVELWLDDAWRWVQVFTGDTLPHAARRSLAVEPMTSPADAFNSGTDLVVIEPGQSWSGTFGIRLGR